VILLSASSKKLCAYSTILSLFWPAFSRMCFTPALNLLKNEKTAKRGIKLKRNKAGWDTKYLEQVLGF